MCGKLCAASYVLTKFSLIWPRQKLCSFTTENRLEWRSRQLNIYYYMKMNRKAEIIFTWFRTKTRLDTRVKGNLALSTLRWRNRSENASNVFRPHYATLSQVILDWWLTKTRPGKSRDLVTSSFSKSCDCPHWNVKWLLQTPQVWRAFSTSSVFVTD